MELDIEGALRSGIDRTVARNGLLLVGLLFVVSAINGLVGAGATRWVVDRGILPRDWPVGGAADAPFAVNPAIAALVSLVAFIATIALTLGALRILVTDETERLPSEHFTQNLLWPGINFFVGVIVFAVIVAIGLVLLIVPGIFLLVTLAFWTIYVAVEDRNFVEGMQASWGLTRGHRLRLFLLGVAVVLVNLVVGIVFGIGVVGGPTVEILLGQLGSALTTVFSLATLTAAYGQLVGSGDEPAADDGGVELGA